MTYSIDDLKALANNDDKHRPGWCKASYDQFMNTWRVRYQLDQNRIWFLSVFVNDDGEFDKYCLDQELAEDSHYEFKDEIEIRKALYSKGDEELDFPDVLVRYVSQYGGVALLNVIRQYVLHEFHYD